VGVASVAVKGEVVSDVEVAVGCGDDVAVWSGGVEVAAG
jgi:hypothetical protein